MNPDGWQESDGDLPFLPKQDGFDGLRRFFDDLLRPVEEAELQQRQTSGPQFNWTPLRFACSVCDGDGRLAHQDERECTWLMTCPACMGTGSMLVVPERRGIE